MGYGYTIRDWVARINDPGSAGTFAAGYTYQPDGAIEASQYTNPLAGEYTYDYSYDELNRLTGADFRSGGVNPASFDLQGLSYDRNGNIQGLRRFGGESELIDSLDYDYSGNRLTHLVDAVVDTASGGGETPIVQTIYEESLASPWIDASWSATVDYASTDIASGGTTSIRVDQQAWGAFSVRSGSWSGGVPIEADIYDEITFDVYAPTQEVTIAVLLEGDGQSYSYQYWGTVPAGQWVPVTMNLDALNPNDNYFLRIDIQETSGAARTFYIDNFRLSGTQTDTTQVLATRGAHSANFEHDDSGNLIYQSGVFSGIGYEWRGLPTRFDLTGGGQVRAAYNAEGQRILKTTPGGWEFYLRDGDRIMAVLDSSGVRHRNLYGNGLIGRLQAQGGTIDTTSPRRYYLKDHLGSIRAVADGQGNILESYDYYPFGMLMAARSDTIETTRELFTSQERDPRLGLDYFGARYYDPAIGRWLSRDPLASKYPSLSPYNYVANNPVNAIDPDGQDIWFVHGTFSNPGTWGAYMDAISAWENVLNDQIFGRNSTNLLASTGNFRWSGENNISARNSDAKRLASQIAEARNRNPEMLVQLVGHSHGGNVTIEASNILKQEYGITVDRLLLLGTPNRSDYQLIEGAVADLVNVYSNQDEVQSHGGNISSLGMSSRFRKGAKNIMTGTVLVNDGNGSFSIKRIGKQGPISSHVTIHNTQELIDYVNRILNEDEIRKR